MKADRLVFSLVSVVATLWASAGAGARGELCHAWRGVRARGRGAFLCPERGEKSDALFCCGRCELRYCCGNVRDRLDQGACSEHEEEEADNTEQHAPDFPVYVPFLIVVCVFVVFLLLVSIVAVCFCLNQKPLTPQPRHPPVEDPSHTEPAAETIPMTTSTGTSCGSSSSLFPLSVTSQSSVSVSPPVPLHPTLEKERPPPSSYTQPPPLAFYRTMTLPAMLHPLMFPTGLRNLYMMPPEAPRVYRSVPSPCPPASRTGTMQRTSEVIV